MIAPARLRLPAIVPLALAAWLAASATATAQATKTTIPKAEPKAKAETKSKDEPKAKAGPVELNTATSEELMTLPGVGPATARKIVEGRPYKEVSDLAKAEVPAATIAKIQGSVEVKPLPAPVDINNDPAAKLETLPGIGAGLASEIIAGRPFATYEDVGKLKGIGAAKLEPLHGRLKFGTQAAASPKAKMKEAEASKEVTAEKKARAKAAETREVAAEAKPAATEKAKPAEPKPPKLPPGTKVNINTAKVQELDELFGIGPVKAAAIVEARPFEKIEDIMKVRGIKEGEFAKIKDYITVK